LAHSRKHSEQAVILNDPLKLTSPRGFGDFDDIGTSCLVLLTGTLWALGYPAQALGKIRESLKSARELSHPLSQAISWYGATELYVRCREVEKSQEQAEALIALCRQHGFRLWEALGVASRGWALANQGRAEEGIAQIRQSIGATQAMGLDLWQPYSFALLGDTYERLRQPEQGLKAIAQALDLTSRTGAVINGPGLHRTKGELLMMRDRSQFHLSQARLRGSASLRIVRHAGQAEGCFRYAIEMAREQGAKSWELRATISLARLLYRQGHREEARTMLAEIYNWFTEGFDTADLKEAKALLDELGQ
jgi:tetratricopeptide (TPR) repeat protein